METGQLIEIEGSELDKELTFEVSKDVKVTTKITFRKGDVIEKLIKRIVDLENKINKDEKFYILNDKEAEMKIQDLIKRFKLQKRTNINMIDINNELNIPIEQIEKIMSELEEKKIVLQNE